MAIPAGPYIEAFVTELARRLQDVASQLYDLDQSASLAILDDADKYTGKTHDVLADVSQDRTWLWPAYTETRERVERAVDHASRRDWDEARREVAAPLALSGVPPHDDLAEVVTLIADTARAVLEVSLLVVPKMGEHLGALSEARAHLGTVEEQAALVGMSHSAEVSAARIAVNEAFEAVTADPLSVDPSMATNAVKLASDAISHAREELQRLPRRMAAADTLLYEIDVLIQRGREALDRTRSKIAHPEDLLVPLAPDILNHGPQALRPRLDRLSRAAAEGDNRAALVGMRSWERSAQQLQAQATRIIAANEAPLTRRNELRGLVGALQAKAAATGLAEDPQAQALYDAAHEQLWVAPCDLAKAQDAVDDYRRFLADR